MLDLSTYVEKKYELKWFDGELLHLKKPTQGLMMKIVELDSVDDTQKQLQGMKELVMGILQNNEEKRVFTDEEYELLTFDVVQAILTDYMNTVVEELGK